MKQCKAKSKNYNKSIPFVTVIALIVFSSCTTKNITKNNVLEGNWELELQSYDAQITKEIRGTTKDSRKQTSQPSEKQPLKNYQELFEKSVKLTEEKIFDKKLLQNKKWKKFVKNMNKVVTKMQDDVEMVLAFSYFANKLPFSHYGLIKPPPQTQKTHDNMPRYVFLRPAYSNGAYMQIPSFAGTAKEMDSMFVFVRRWDYGNLIVDFRNNRGGSIETGLAFLQNLINDTLFAGIALAQNWFNKNNRLPTVEEYKSFPYFSLANQNSLAEMLENVDGAYLKAIPNAEVYNGNIFILTSKYTGCACEIIIYALKQHKIATIIGEKTAGQVLAGDFFDLDEGFKMQIPSACYYASDGKRLDQLGIAPDIKVKSAKALDYVIKNLLK